MINKQNTWLTLLGFAFLLGVIFVIFAFASRKPEAVIVKETATKTLTEPTVTIIDPARGATKPVVTIVEFGDYACDACEQLDTNLSKLLLKYPDQLRVVWKDFPNESLHAEAMHAAVAARCADEQKLFWQYHDELFLRRLALSDATYSAITTDLGLNANAFASCLKSQSPRPRVDKSVEEGQALSLTATPTMFIGQERWVGSLDLAALQTIIEDHLK